MKKTIKDYQYKDKTVIIRCDLNVPIKNNKIVGALTNVLVSDPQIGYGVFADIMIKEMMK